MKDQEWRTIPYRFSVRVDVDVPVDATDEEVEALLDEVGVRFHAPPGKGVSVGGEDDFTWEEL